MTDPGPQRTSFALFGGPGFILALLAVFSVVAAGFYLASGDRLRGSSGASMSLPGDLGNARLGHQAETDDTSLEPLQPLQAPAPAAPVPEEEPAPQITEDLSPLDLLVRYTPDQHLALTEDASATGALRFRRPSSVTPGTKRLALVVTGLGLDRALTAQTIVSLPPEATLSFAAGSADLPAWIAAARAYGHEALIDLEFGTADGLDDAGEDRLLAELGPQENLRRLEMLLARAPEAAGVHVRVSDAFLADAAALTPILDKLQAGGWLVVGLPVTAPLTVAADRQLEAPLTPDVLAQESVALKSLARQRGAALTLASAANAGPLAQSLTRGNTEIALVPASALVEN